MIAAFVSLYPWPGMPAVGGVEVATARLARELQRQHIHETVVAPGSGSPNTASRVPVVRLDIGGQLGEAGRVRCGERFSADAMADSCAEAARRLLGPRGRGAGHVE